MCRKLAIKISYYTYCEQFVHISSLVGSIYNIWTGNFDTSTWSLTYNLVVPFETKTIWSWYFMWFLQCNMGFSYASCMVPVTVYFVCCCIYLCAIGDHFKLLIGAIKKDAEQFQGEKNLPKKKDIYKRIKENLCNAVDVHVTLIE